MLEVIKGQHEGKIGVAGVKGLVCAAQVQFSMELVGSRFGRDLDTAHAQIREGGGIGVAIDPNRANGRFWGQAAAAEAVDQKLRSSEGAGQSTKLLQQRRWIVGQRPKTVPLKDLLAAATPAGGVVLGDTQFLVQAGDGEPHWKVEFLPRS